MHVVKSHTQMFHLSLEFKEIHQLIEQSQYSLVLVNMFYIGLSNQISRFLKDDLSNLPLYLFWITHPTRQLGALSKRDYYIFIFFFSDNVNDRMFFSVEPCRWRKNTHKLYSNIICNFIFIIFCYNASIQTNRGSNYR